MKLLLVTPYLAAVPENGGVPAVVRALARGLAAAGHQVTVLTDDRPGGAAGAGLPAAVEVVHLEPLLRYRMAALSRGAGSFCRQRLGTLDAVHVFCWYHPLGARVARRSWRRGVPYVVEPSGMLPPLGRSLLKKHVYQALLGRKVLARAAAVVATGAGERADLLRAGADPARTHVRRNGLDLDQFRAPVRRGLLRAELSIPDGTPVVLYVGRLAPVKGVDLLLRAFGALPSGPRLVLVGPEADARHAAALRRLAGELGVASRVHFAGVRHAPAVREALADADLFVLPSRRECFGAAAAEAVAAGLPVVVTEEAGVAPIVRDRAGLVVAAEPEAIAGALRRLLTDAVLRERLRTGCDAVAAELSWDGPVAAMAGLYHDLARARGGAGRHP
jgi:glycosyltransferase involved in cell wall biosynthesis